GRRFGHGQGSPRPTGQLFRIVVKPLRQRVPAGDDRFAAFPERERLRLLRKEGLAGLGVGLEIDRVAEDHADHDLASADALAAEDRREGEGPESREQIVEAVRVARHDQSSFAGVIETLSPQPQAAVWLGLLKTKRAASLSRTKSISVPMRNMIALGSMKTF